eukprot:3227067-Amphidinium_carterae.2
MAAADGSRQNALSHNGYGKDVIYFIFGNKPYVLVFFPSLMTPRKLMMGWDLVWGSVLGVVRRLLTTSSTAVQK